MMKSFRFLAPLVPLKRLRAIAASPKRHAASFSSLFGPTSIKSFSSLTGPASTDTSQAYELADTTAAVSKIADTLDGLPRGLSAERPSIYVSVEGDVISQHGAISILQLHLLPSKQTHLVDVRILGDKSFSSAGENGKTLKDILESPSIPKVFWDVRSKSAALFSQFKIDLAGVQDLQLMEFASRPGLIKRWLCSLSKCIERDASLTPEERRAWEAAREKGKELFLTEDGRSYEPFIQRPRPKGIYEYCTRDIQFLPRLWEYYDKRLPPTWRARVLEASRDRVKLSQAAEYDGDGNHMPLPPIGWAYRKLSFKKRKRALEASQDRVEFSHPAKYNGDGERMTTSPVGWASEKMSFIKVYH